MKSISLYFIFTLFLLSTTSKSNLPENYTSSFSPAPVCNILLSGNNIQTPFRSDGIFNYDKINFSQTIAGLIWPVNSNFRRTIDYTTGLWLGAKVVLPDGSKDIRTAVSFYNSIFTPGNIPQLGQVPPQSVCDDPAWKGYLVNLVDQSLVNGGIRTRIISGTSYTVTYDSWANWPVDKGAPYVEVNGIPGYQPGWNSDRPGIGFGNSRPAEICFMTYMDYTNCTNNIHAHEISMPGGTLPMGVEVQQLAYDYNCPGFENSYFISWKVLNRSAHHWDSVYVGIANDADVGDANDDAVGCDTTRDISFMYNADNYDTQYGNNPPAIGSRILQGPLYFTGNNNDTVRLPYHTYVGYKMLGMTVSSVFPNPGCFLIQGQIDNGYNWLSGLDKCGLPFRNPITNQVTTYAYSGDACMRSSWFDSLSSDRQYLQSTGPFNMNSGDTQVIAMTFVIGRGSNNFQSVCEVLNSSDVMKDAYYNGLCTSVNGLKTISRNVPSKFELYQNYPNPFNPTTKIKFDVAGKESQQVRLIIIDALGREVSTLVNEQMKPGSYETDWDSINFPSGVYFYRIEAGTFTETKKMILLK